MRANGVQAVASARFSEWHQTEPAVMVPATAASNSKRVNPMNTQEREELPELPLTMLQLIDEVAHNSNLTVGLRGRLTQDSIGRLRESIRAYGRLCRAGRGDVDYIGYADSLEQMAESTYHLRGGSLPDDCKECLWEAAAILRRLSPQAGGSDE